jgi:hypothetical protein
MSESVDSELPLFLISSDSRFSRVFFTFCQTLKITNVDYGWLATSMMSAHSYNLTRKSILAHFQYHS